VTEATSAIAPTEVGSPSAEPDPQVSSRADLDELVGGLDDLADRPVAEHHDRLAEVHEALHSALHEPPPAS
jgi:hypothetical protein